MDREERKQKSGTSVVSLLVDLRMSLRVNGHARGKVGGTAAKKRGKINKRGVELGTPNRSDLPQGQC